MQAQTSSTAADIAEVDRLLRELRHNLEEARLSLKEQEQLLAKVKVFGRDPRTAGPIFTQEGIATLSRYSFDKGSTDISREALRCLANAFLLNEPSRQKFVDMDFAPKAVDRLKLESIDDEFLISRMLLLLTYNTTLDFEPFLKGSGLADSLNLKMVQHSAALCGPGSGISQAYPMQKMALVETLKLIFNLSNFYPGSVSMFTPSVEPLVNLLIGHPLPTPPLQPPITFILNALLNLDLQAGKNRSSDTQRSNASSLFPAENPNAVVDRLTSVLYKAIREHPERDLDQAAASLCTVLRRVHEIADTSVQVRMRVTLLPGEQDRDKPLGQGETLPAKLLKLSSSPNLPTLGENISGLLFELSDKDANKFVKNIGYGYASGFLMRHNIEVPLNAMGSSNNDANVGDDVNPVTGQRLNAEDNSKSALDDMTEEEKEREAERLFVLFERLRATGVVDVENPVKRARDEGRFEEIE